VVFILFSKPLSLCEARFQGVQSTGLTPLLLPRSQPTMFFGLVWEKQKGENHSRHYVFTKNILNRVIIFISERRRRRRHRRRALSLI
jgi:hypothetical protein